MKRKVPELPRLQADDLRQLQRRKPSSAERCRCDVHASLSWESVAAPVAEPGFECVGTLAPANEDRNEDGNEDDGPTLTEWHPQGTGYWSPAAPIAVAWFPYNRCSVWRCRGCGRGFVQYTEFGGYYVDHRLRAVDPALVV